MDIVRCCKNCEWYSPISTWTYKRDGKVNHKPNNGFACTVFTHKLDGFVIHKIGIQPELGLCECFNERNNK